MAGRIRMSFRVASLLFFTGLLYGQANHEPSLAALSDAALPRVPIRFSTTGDAATNTVMPVKMPVYVKNGKKEEYVGPKTIVVLDPTPMLDEEGKQRVDPDGKLMFNPPVKQQRDKRGNPLFDEKGIPVFQTKTEMGYDEHGKKIHLARVKPPRQTSVSIVRGIFTVDGIVGKAELNYDIVDLQFLYFYVPGKGVTVVSHHAFAGAQEQPKAFDGKTLTVKADDHILQLSSDNRLLGKQSRPAFVLVNRNFQLPSRYPVVGYGVVSHAPYNWPGSHPNQRLNGVPAPPIPENLRPQMLMKPCPAGQMRLPVAQVLPGQPSRPQPCVPMAQAQEAQKVLLTKQATPTVSSEATVSKSPSY